MTLPGTTIYLRPEFFTERERLLARHATLSAYAFRFKSGVCALRIENGLGSLVLLPYQGQQIWSAEFGGRDLTMRSMFPEPRATRRYAETYGGFLLHCGATSAYRHPGMGELPNAPYQSAHLVVGVADKGPYIGLGGRYQHTVAFATNYVALPLVRLYAGRSSFDVSMTIENLKRTEMELMYLAHINFRPVDNGRLVYSAHPTPEKVRVRPPVRSRGQDRPGYQEFLAALSRRPEKHHVLAPDLIFDPEIVFHVEYEADEDGWAHSMQVHPDGSADYVRHRPGQLDASVRWICRTPDWDALGLVLPGTSAPEGYLTGKAGATFPVIPPGGHWHFDLELGVLNAAETAEAEARVEALLALSAENGIVD